MDSAINLLSPLGQVRYHLSMWVIGQRVLAEFEPELGLGVVVDVIGARLVEISFPGAQIKRRYSQQVAPLRRLVLTSGQKVRSKDGKEHTILEAREIDGLFQYKSEKGAKLWEHELDHLVEDTTPLTRFLLGQWGAPKTFELRKKAWELRGKSLAPNTRGLVGSRVSLLPHQLGIAAEVARREFPRVLLSDEVGLGKTIEAGLIFASLRALGRANRVLILVPEALEHQWLAEMYRRFQEMFSLVDEERSEQEELSLGKSAFQMNQRVLCSLPFLAENAERLEQAAQEKWDLIIVDEAHRLEWNQDDASAEWEIVKLLSERTRGLLLLTATPQREGIETQFGLLNLVDPDRFPDFDAFQKENAQMKEVARLAKGIQEENRNPTFLKELRTSFGTDKDLLAALKLYGAGALPNDLLDRLVDRHGTGRVLIRNRRSRIQGFPERKLVPHALPTPENLIAALGALDAAKLSDSDLLRLSAGIESAAKKNQGTPSPWSSTGDWFQARAKHLHTFLEKHKGEKVLLICSSSVRVRALQEWLRNNSSIRSAIFDENLEIVERDRQAAWFSQDEGAQILLCSEIGGEGRNFQFCHHLFLFDLPLHPDTLEQRIGRLDRIGQKQEIQIHAPFFKDTPEEVLLHWYSEGLSVFTRPWNGATLGPSLQTQIKDCLRAYLPKAKEHPKREKMKKSLLASTQTRAAEIQKDQENGVDLLVDINSFNRGEGLQLAETIRSVDHDPSLREFTEATFNYFGVEIDKLDEAGKLKLSAHSMSFVESFPGLSSNGELLATFDRNLALHQEELSFLTWEHPVIQGAFSLILEADVGRISAGVVSDLKPVKSPQDEKTLIELLYILQPTAPAHLEVEHDFPLHLMRFFITPKGKWVEPPPGLARATLQSIPPQAAEILLEPLREDFNKTMLQISDSIKLKAAPLIQKALQSYETRLNNEHARLKALAEVNYLISKAELKAHREKMEQGVAALKSITPRLDAIRLLRFQ